jgi:hypothetical protein
MMPPKLAAKFIVGLLYIADIYNCEDDVGTIVSDLIQDDKPLPSILTIEQRYRKTNMTAPEIIINQHSIKDYDQFLKT